LQQARKQFLAAAMEQNRQNKPLAAASTHTELSKRAEQSCLQQLEHTHIREKRAEQLEQNRYSHQKKNEQSNGFLQLANDQVQQLTSSDSNRM
jgi:hypothetical protein